MLVGAFIVMWEVGWEDSSSSSSSSPKTFSAGGAYGGGSASVGSGTGVLVISMLSIFSLS